MEVKQSKFRIDFFELCFLVEACIPPSPIARAMFWENVIDGYYHEMTPNERNRLFNWVNRNHSMQKGIEDKNTDCLLFNARFDPKNQYLAYCKFEGEDKTQECFLWEGRYYISKTKSINEDYITKIEPLCK